LLFVGSVSYSGKVNDEIKSGQGFVKIGFEVQIDHVQLRIDDRNFFPVPAAPKFQVAIQKQLPQHANCERRRGAGNQNSHDV